MDIKEIDRLIERYFNGESTEAEEKMLGDFFAGGDVPARLTAEREMFLAMQGLTPPAGFDGRREANIDNRSARSRGERLRSRLRALVVPLSGIAACGAIVLAGIFSMNRVKTTVTQPEMTPEEVSAHAEMALSLLAGTFKKGLDGVEMAETKACETTAKAYKVMNEL